METPKSIYLQVCGDCPLTDCDNCKFDENGVTWSIDRIFPKDVEYVRKDSQEDAMRYVMEHHSPSEVSDFQAAMNIAVMKAYNAGKEDTIIKACDWLANNDSYSKPTHVQVEELKKYLS